MKKLLNEIKLLLKSKDNRTWYFKNWRKKLIAYFTGFITAWTLLDAFNINFTTLLENAKAGSTKIVLVLAVLTCVVISAVVSMKELKGYLHVRVEGQRPGCSVEIRVADSYLTNAFKNYPNCAMIIGINKAFWFQEAEPKSLIADMWEILKEKGIEKEEVQRKIDAELSQLWTDKDGNADAAKKATYIDQQRDKVRVKSAEMPEEGVLRDNYKIGTVIGVDLNWEEGERKILKKLYLIANSEVVQGVNMKEPMKVTYDRNASVVESFGKIWDFFEERERMTEYPPKHVLYAPLLIPLIGAGVANEGYSDLEIFSKIVDLYYERLRASVQQDKQPAIPNLIINIQSKTAIEISEAEIAGHRRIDLKTAFWYLKYRNEVRPIEDRYP
ncbi:MAG: hypothetical protein IKL06_03415 [Lachnospiraceae bacterium]|nr:hypothetical protein [Lachnospiraceae bacterium]